MIPIRLRLIVVRQIDVQIAVVLQRDDLAGLQVVDPDIDPDHQRKHGQLHEDVVEPHPLADGRLVLGEAVVERADHHPRKRRDQQQAAGRAEQRQDERDRHDLPHVRALDHQPQNERDQADHVVFGEEKTRIRMADLDAAPDVERRDEHADGAGKCPRHCDPYGP